MRSLILVSFSVALLSAVEHPFILWTPAEAAAIRDRLEKDPLAPAQLARMAGGSAGRDNWLVWDLFRYQILGDAEAGEKQLAKLREFIGSKPEPMTWERDPETLKWNVGAPSHGDRHMRDEQTLNVLRYDVLYDRLTEEEREGVKGAMRAYIDFHLDGHQPWHPQFKYTRNGWLPNMQWPRTIGTHLMAVALKDQALIEKMFTSVGGWKYFFDDYLADGQFYMEEFGKYYSNIGSMLMYCEALEELGLGRYGYGYVGRGGANMQKFLQMLPRVGYPRLRAPAGGTPQYAVVTMGDTGDLHSMITGYGHPGKKGKPSEGQPFWRAAHMNGPLPKLQAPGWYEIGHARFPDAGFDYFLAQLRTPDEAVYLPSLYWNLHPIHPTQTVPPPAPSLVSRERGFALLRAEESGAYWQSPQPAVALQFGMYYVHYVHDCFSILQYIAHNREIYNRMGRPEGRKGYAGGDDWKDHVRGHNGVVVDGAQAKPVDDGNEGTPNHRIREDLRGPGRFVSVQAAGIYEEVDQQRQLLLTDEYLLDCFRLASDRPRTYDWQVLAFGATVDRGGERWRAVADWRGRDMQRLHLRDSRLLAVGAEPWQVEIQQAPDAGRPGVGVRLRMLPDPDTETLVLDSQPPGMVLGAGTSILVSRHCPTTTFIALHEPFEGSPADTRLQSFERLAGDARGAVLRITGAGLVDYIGVSFENEPTALRYEFDADGDGSAEASLAFTGFTLIHQRQQQIQVQGELAEALLPRHLAPTLAPNQQSMYDLQKESAQIRLRRH